MDRSYGCAEDRHQGPGNNPFFTVEGGVHNFFCTKLADVMPKLHSMRNAEWAGFHKSCGIEKGGVAPLGVLCSCKKRG